METVQHDGSGKSISFSRALSAFVVLLVTNQALAGESPPNPGNILIVLADDLGVEMVPAYGEGSNPPKLSVIDSLAANGVLFRNAYANSVCSPTRACVQTGRHSFRTGIGTAVQQYDDFALLESEITLPEMLDAGTGAAYAHAAFGKWHLGTIDASDYLAPNKAGWSHFAGSRHNLDAPEWNCVDYYNWEKVIDGVPQPTTVYATTDTVDSALAWLATAPEPWICYVAFNAPHDPFHKPPTGLFSEDLSGAGDPELNPWPYYKAMTEAMDAELGRLLTSIDSKVYERTTVIFMGDNGSPPEVAAAGKAKAKGTVFEGGINVPLIVSGPMVSTPGSESGALVDAVDLFPTVADIAAVDLKVTLGSLVLDGQSLLPYLLNPSLPSLRLFDYAERFKPNKLGGQDPPGFMCQQDLGLGGPGSSLLSVCGQPLYSGNKATMVLRNGPPNAPALLLVAIGSAPVSLGGSYLLPSPYLAVVTVPLDSQGSFSIDVPGGLETSHSRRFLYCQVIAPETSLPLGWNLSNMVELDFLKTPVAQRAIRNVAGFKLVLRSKFPVTGPVHSETMYDLVANPTETNNLLASGLAGLTTSQLVAYHELKLALTDLLH